jgi:hypothetical protein
MPEMVLQNELERLKRFDDNLKWFQLHYDELPQQSDCNYKCRKARRPSQRWKIGQQET